ncbi:MAG: hypothetical protein ABI693_13265 [Bryobacteraceae bacterium]
MREFSASLAGQLWTLSSRYAEVGTKGQYSYDESGLNTITIQARTK